MLIRLNGTAKCCSWKSKDMSSFETGRKGENVKYKGWRGLGWKEEMTDFMSSTSPSRRQGYLLKMNMGKGDQEVKKQKKQENSRTEEDNKSASIQ